MGEGSVAGDEYLRNMNEARVCPDQTVGWVEVCYCPTPLQEERPYWEEYFDHLVRNEASLSRIIRYVQDNPQKAGLRDWPWAGTEELRSAGFQPAADSEKAVFL